MNSVIHYEFRWNFPQRELTAMYELVKLVKTETTVLYQYYSMPNNGKWANWLSKEGDVKNPYYGFMMLSYESTVETIK